jgi:hypothetical protein
VLPVNRSMASMTALVELAITRETMLRSTLSLPQILSGWRVAANRAILASDVGCVYRKLDSAIVVMKAAEQRMRFDASDPLNRAR